MGAGFVKQTTHAQVHPGDSKSENYGSAVLATDGKPAAKKGQKASLFFTDRHSALMKLKEELHDATRQLTTDTGPEVLLRGQNMLMEASTRGLIVL